MPTTVDYFVQLECTLRAIYLYFSHSSVRLERLKLIFNVLDKKFVRLQKLFEIRWLSQLHLHVIKAVLQSYEALVVYFDDQANEDVTADGIVRRLKGTDLLFLCISCVIFFQPLVSLTKHFNFLHIIPVALIEKSLKYVTKALKSRYFQ